MKCIRRGMRKANAGLEVGNMSRQAPALVMSSLGQSINGEGRGLPKNGTIGQIGWVTWNSEKGVQKCVKFA